MPVEKIKSIFSDPSSSPERIQEQINLLDPFEIARRLHEVSVEDKIRLFHLLDSDVKRQTLLYETDHDSRLEIQESMETEKVAHLLEEMAEDEAADLLQEHPEETRAEILGKMEPAEAETIKDLITYGEETAGGLMAVDFNQVRGNPSVADILMNLKRDPNKDSPPYFYLLGDNDELLGYVKLRDLLNVSAQAKIADIIYETTPKVYLDDPCEKVANLMDHEQLSTIPVVDENNVMHGIITFDDVIRTMQDIASEDIFTMVGTARVDPFAKSTAAKISARAPWLFTTFLGGLMSALILGVFKDSLAEFTTIILFVPFVIGLAGNVGIQGATVIVRGMATGDIQEDNLATVRRSELRVGICNGLIFGTLCGGFVAALSGPLLHTSPLLGLTVGLGIFLAVAFAALVGSLAPNLFKKWGIDPAISTGPFVTVVNDMAGLAIYLITAAWIFSYL